MGFLEDYGNKLLELGFDRWHSRTGLAIVIGAIVVAGVAVFAGIDITNVSLLEWTIIGAIGLAASLLWLKSSIERVPRSHVGFGVAIEFEHSAHAEQLRADFVRTLRDLLSRSRHQRLFHFIEFRQSVAKRITGGEQAIWLAKKSGVHFLIHGRARLRTTPPGQSHVLDLSWLVRHGRIATAQSRALAQDASAVFPTRLIVGTSGDVFAFEVAAQHVDAVARYVIGTASAISGDFVYAEELLLDSERTVAALAQRADGDFAPVLLDRVRKRLAEIYIEWMNQVGNRYTTSRDREALREVETIVEKLRRYDPDNPGARMSAAMAAFMLRRDIGEARREIDRCRHLTDATWMYSDAFLLAYEGDLEGAYRAYRRAFQSPLSDPTVPMQCEDFIQMVIDEEPNRPWLYYCLGLINYRAKGDLQAARADFATFIERADPATFVRHIDIATEWIKEIDARLRAA
jgi:tetratricopeptide (TPR) repeat protein